ncbi:hypothetical protein [Streptomyces sp. Cmuel-A718b]|uniref:hypothetical protein n=1 Tax=Streptomyces sp. Cmuel-A718b TaxID=697328 RepID=UPI00081ECE1D|nr:hypothetical protein [Streptomyces sp. Cmuel-A718b]SCF58261.1 hypothetical protein GA0115280_102534 [Streptomyces sp. Cmuel-A718b]
MNKFAGLSAVELARPLWEIPPADRTEFLAARARLRPDYDADEDQRVTEWAETE